MRLHQIKITHDAEQDRLLMRVSTTTNEEVKLWLTRRCVTRLWPTLVKAAQSLPEIASQANPQAKHALLEFQHEHALSEADFSKPYAADAAAHPMGGDPLLVVRIIQRQDRSGLPVLGLLPREGKGIFVSLDANLLHGLLRLLQAAVARADWGFTLSLPPSSAPGTPEGARRTLN